MSVLNKGVHNEHGGYVAAVPSSVTYGGFNGGDDGSGLNVANNLSFMYQTNAGNMYITIHNNKSSLDMDMGFVEFTLNVTVPAGAKVKVKYKFDVTAFKSACSSDASSHYCAEFFHYGTGVNGDGANPVTIASQSFATSSSSGANSQIRLDGGLPTYVYSDSVSGDPSLNASHIKATYPNHGGFVSGCESAKTGTYTTTEITYENTSSTNKSYKEYFGFMGCTAMASGSCHMLDAQVDITPVQVEFEKVAKPAVSGLDNYTYDGAQKTFTVSGIDATKTKLVKAVKTGLDGVDSTIYEYDYSADSVITGTNPITGNQCKFTDAGVYTLSFRHKGAIWSDSAASPSTSAYDLKLYIFPKKVNKPTVAAADASGKTYGGTAQTFTLSMSGGLTATNWSDYISIEAAKGGNLPTGVTDNANGSFSITDAGEYDVYLSLKDEKNTCWGDKTYDKTTWSGSGAGGTAQVTLKVNPFELTVASSCDKLDNSSKWAWNMGEEATVTLNVSGFKLATDTTDGDPLKVTLNYYYRLGTGADSSVTAESETYDPATKTITAKVKLPTTLAQGSYTFGVAPDENAGAGKNYTVKKSIVEKAFTISAKAFDPSTLLWTYSVDGVTDITKLLADGDKFTYALNADGTAKVYNPIILLKNDSYDHTDKIDIDSVGYTGDKDKSAVSGSYKTTVKLKVIDSEIKFANPTNNSNIVVASDGQTATVAINWQIEKGTFDLSGIKWEYWYKDNKGGEHSGDYSTDLEYNDGLYIYVRVKADSLPDGLTLNSDYTDVVPPKETYGDRQRNVGTYNLTFDALSDFDYDSSSFNAPDAMASTLKLTWKIVPKKIVAKFKLTKRSYTNSNGSGSYYIRELDLSGMGCSDAFKSYFTLKYYDSTNAEVTLADIDAAADPTNEKTYTVKAFIDTSVTAANNYVIVDAAGNTPTTTFKTGSSNSPASFTIDGKDGSSPIKLTYDGNPQFGGSLIEVKADDGTVITDYKVTYYKGATPVAGNELADGELPTDVGTYCVEITLTGSADSIYILQDSYYTVDIEKQELTVTVDGSDGSAPVELTYDGKPHFDKISLKGENGSELDASLYTVKYYDGEGNELATGVVPENAGEYTAVIALAGGAVGNYDLSADTFVLKIGRQAVTVTVDGSDGSAPVELTYDGKPHFDKISLKGENGSELDASLYTVKYYDGEGNELATGVVPENAGEYTAVIALAGGAVENYDLSADTFVLEIGKIGIDIPTVGEITFSNSFINLAEKLGGSYAQYKDVIELGGVFDGVKNAGSYKATLTLTNGNYFWKSAETGAQLNSRKVALFEGESATISGDGTVATLDWSILPYVLKADNWDMSGKTGAIYNLPAELVEGLDVTVNYNYFTDKASEALESGSELAKGTQYFVKAELLGADAGNFVFADTLATTSDFAEYSIPAGFLTNAYGFLKTNWLWFVIGAAVLLFLIILICIIASAKKKKKKREALEEQRRLEKEEREREERRLEREERMARMSQQQAMPQYIPQPMPQYMPQPQPQPQYAPQSQPMSMGGNGGGSVSEAQFMQMQAELATLKASQESALRAEVMRVEQAAIKAEQAAKESAMRAEQNAVLRSDVNALRNGEQVGGISVDAMTEIMTAALKNVFMTASQQAIAGQPAQPAQLTDGTNANAAPAAAQVPPDAVMTTVTTTKIDTTKKAQNGQGNAQPTRQTRSFVPPMPVDDGRVFDVGGFYTPADPMDLVDSEDDKK